MKQVALVLIASLAAIGSARAQAWPNAAPSPYGSSTTAPTAATAPQTALPPATHNVELGSPPHALGSAPPSMPALPPPQAATAEPPVADLDNPQSQRATTALNILEAQGYTYFGDFRPDGNMFTALVHDGGQQFRVVINPDTGQISRQ